MEILRTPDERFASLPGWSYPPRYVEVPSGDGGTLRVHYVDEGSGAPVLMLHGEPSWSFLWRKVMRPVIERGLRAIAIDLVGFGRSDKPSRREDYTYQRHVDWVRGALDAIGLDGISLVCQDWGGLIGLRLVGEQPDRFARVVAANTFLPTGDQKPGPAFFRWRAFSQEVPDFRAGRIVKGACARELPEEVIAAYDAPFPDESYKAGARQFPMLVPASPDDPASEANRRAWAALREWRRPFLTAFGDSDPVTRGGDMLLQALIPGAAGQRHTTLANAAHFLQEDAGEELGAVVAEFAGG
jgi:haloalkane dehalogenase